MNHLTKLEKEVIALPVEERQRLISLALESLEPTSLPDDNSRKIAIERDNAIEEGNIHTISHEKFMQETRSIKR